MQDKALLRLGAVSAVAAAILAAIVNLAHPRVADYSSPDSFLRVMAASNIWVTDHLGIVLAVLLYLGGLTAIYRSITTGKAAAWARLGFAGAMVGIATQLVWASMDGIAMKWIAQAWITAPEGEKAMAFRIAAATLRVTSALSAMWIIVLFGATHLLYGIAILSGSTYPRWLGWVAVIGGAGALVTGVLQSYQGLTALLVNVLLPIFASLLTLWLLVMGIRLWRVAATAK